jgi:RHS repeat-associated protein
LNRLTSASESGDWSQSYSYDQYGNMWMPSSTLTPPALGPVAPTSNVYNPANNQNVYSTYDANGNLTAFGAIGVSYDAENRQTAAGTNSYSYDGAGQRVSKTTGSGQITFVYDAFGQLAAEYAGGTVWTKDYVRAGGQIAAIENAYGAPCTTCYLSYDYLGSPRMVTDQNANIIARHDYAPFGQEIPSGVGVRTSVWGPSDNANQKFTGQERDAETNLDFSQARYLSSGLGRFMSPDPHSAGAALTNPQSWNGYAYVLNDPLDMIDPSGTDGLSPGDPGDPGEGCDDDWCLGFPPSLGPGTGGPVNTPPPPTQTESGGGNTLPPGSPLGGETLGIPGGIGVPSVLQVLLGTGPDAPCDFGACNGLLPPATAPVGVGQAALSEAILQIALRAVPWIAGAAWLFGPAPMTPERQWELRNMRNARNRWNCTASCNLQGIGDTNPPFERVTGTGSGSSQPEACLNAKRAATQAAPLGTYARHCQCACSSQ